MAEKKRRRKVLRSLDDLYAHCDLREVRYRELHAELGTDPDVEPGDAKLNASFMVVDDEILVVTFRTQLQTEHARYAVGVAASYQGKSPFRVDEDMMGTFINSSAALTLVPFLREGISGLATKLQDFPIPWLPLMGPAAGEHLQLVKDAAGE